MSSTSQHSSAYIATYQCRGSVLSDAAAESCSTSHSMQHYCT